MVVGYISVSYLDRVDAGRALAREIAKSNEKADLVLGVARGGVVVAREIADALSGALDVIVPRKIGAPYEPELAIGAISVWGDATVVDRNLVRMVGADDEFIAREIEAQREESERRLLAYRGAVSPPDFHDLNIIVVDDGIATGYTIQAAAQGLRNLGAAGIVVAAPVGAPDSVARLANIVDRVICPLQPDTFFAVGSWYRDFPQVSDEEVITILREYRGRT